MTIIIPENKYIEASSYSVEELASIMELIVKALGEAR